MKHNSEIDSFSLRKRTSPYIIGYVVILSILVFFIMIRNSSRIIWDSRAYPIQMETITDFGDNLYKRIPLDTLWNGQEIFLDLHFGLPSSANYVQIANYDESNVISRINVESSELVKGTPTRYNIQIYQKGRGGEFGTLYVTSYGEYETKLIRVNLDEGKNKRMLETICALSADDFELDKESWDCGYSWMIFLPEDNLGSVDALIQVSSGISRYPRYLNGFKIDENDDFVEIFEKQIGCPLRDPTFYDIDGDKNYKIIFGTNAPFNEKHGSGLTDSHQYIVTFDQDGNIAWKQDLGEGGGNTMISPHPLYDSLMVAVRRIGAFSPEANSSYIYSFQPWDGIILDTTRIEGVVVDIETNYKDPSKWLYVINREKNSIGWVDKQFHVSQLKKYPVTANHIVLGAIKINGKQYCMVNFLNGWAGIVDEDLELVGVFQGVYDLVDAGIDGENKTDDLYIRKCDTNYVNGEKRSRHLHVNMVKRPWSFWFIWRNRWIIISWAILIIAVPGLIAIIRYIRLKIAARKAIEEMNERLSQLIQKLHKSQEEERTALSREIHDNLGQSLVVLQWGIDSIEPDLLNKKLLEETKKQLKTTIEVLLTSIHEISSGLRPPIIDAGLIKTIEWHTKNFQDRTGINCAFSNYADHEPKSKELLTALYRVIQESLTNIIKHASASDVRILLIEQNDSLRIDVVDNGKGIIEKNNGHRKSLGILGMNERLKKYNGIVELKNNKHEGATLSVVLPLKNIELHKRVNSYE